MLLTVVISLANLSTERSVLEAESGDRGAQLYKIGLLSHVSFVFVETHVILCFV